MAPVRPSACLLLTLLTACPGRGDDTGGTTDTTATTATPATAATTGTTGAPDPTTGAGSTTGAADTGTSSGGTTTGGADDTTTTDATTQDTESIDPSCTFPGSTSGDPVDPGPAPECACVDEQGSLTCADPICPVISGGCTDGIGFDDECHGTWSYAEEALDCALAAARDGAPGTLRWSFSANSGFSGRGGFLHLIADRRAIRQDEHYIDLDHQVSDTELWQLRDAAYFDGCLALASFCERLHCFFAGTDGPALSLCLPAFSYDDL